MLKLSTLIKNRLQNAKRIALLAVGSELRADDAAGLLAAGILAADTRRKKRVKFKVFLGETAPENLTGEIKKFAPSHLIIIDSADSGRRPGQVSLINPQEAGGVSFSTHKVPLKIMADYLWESCACSTLIIGIKPKSLNFMGSICPEVKKAVTLVSRAIKEALAGI